jgi:drug/metabolite transporter (DMT)-like permease
MAIFFVLIAGAFVALSNLMMRKSIDSGGTTKGFLVFMMFTAFASAVLLEPVSKGNYSWNGSVALLGALAGLIIAFMLHFLGKALEKGPPGFTFSLLSSSTVMPAILMSFLFGAHYGFLYTPWHAIGSLLVVAGIFWAGRGTSGMQDRNQWILFCSAMFALHVALLVLFQWRSLLLNLPHPEEISSFITAEEIKSVWFLPFMFLTSGLIQLWMFISSERRKPKAMEAFYGILGGAVNGTGTFFLIVATSTATALENAIIFPMYSVAIIVLSNLWGQKLYQERVNWKACQVCALGLIIATVDWKGFLSVFF